MLPQPRFRLLVGAIAALFIVGSLASAEPEKTESKYRLVIEGDLKGESGTKTLNASTEMTFAYALQFQGMEVTVLIESLALRFRENGKETADTFMSKDKIISRKNGEVESELGLDKMSPEQKKVVTASFGTPLCKIQLDASGKEIKRTVTADPDAKLVTESGALASTRLFHPSFPEDKDRWQAPAEVGLGDGGYVRGELTYEKVETSKDAPQVKVKVSGLLTNKEHKMPNGALIANARYEVSGEQIYDRKKKEWLKGKLNLAVSFDTLLQEKKIATTKGTMKITLTPAEK